MEDKDLQNLTDEELCALAQGGNSSAENALISRYLPLVKFRASSNRNQLVEASDLAQEGLIGLLSAIRCYKRDGGASFSTYSYICINRSMLAFIKKAEKRAGISTLSLDELDHNIIIDTHSLPSFEEYDSADKLIHEYSDRLQKKLSSLEYRVLLFRMAGYSVSEIAVKLGKSQKSVYNAVQRARSKLM